MTLMRYTPSNLPASAMRALAPHWGALLGLALFLIAGLAVVDDYGAHWDEFTQRQNAEANLRYLADGDFSAFISGLYIDPDKFYGMAFEAPVLLIERAFGIDDDRRAVNLSRHLHSRLLFLAGGLFAYLLALRLFGNRLLALAAMLLFLLHPRLYGHSFFNSKDIPFLVMFIIALFLAHRAFRRDKISTFALLGAAVGILMNLRIMGVVLLAAIPTLRALDFALASGWTERKRVLLDAEPYRLAYEAAASGEPLARSAFDVYLADRALVYVKEPCEQEDVAARFFLHVVPRSVNDLPEERRGIGFDNMDFDFFPNGALFDGRCAARVPLPDYPIASVRTGQHAGGGELWRAEFALNAEPYRAAYEDAVSGEPVARGAFDVHLSDGALVYVKEPCEQGDTDAKFFLHIAPELVGDLPEERRESGFDNFDFEFFLNGALFDGKCAARVPLPDYAVASIRTGQSAEGSGESWRAEFAGPSLR